MKCKTKMIKGDCLKVMPDLEEKFYNIAQQRIKENNVLLVRP